MAQRLGLEQRGGRGLPGVGTRFVGRRLQLERLEARLREGGDVLLWGPAGVGKSRLALEVLSRRAAQGTGGVLGYADLARVGSVEEALFVIGRALDVELGSGVEAGLAQIRGVFEARAGLLVLEHLEGLPGEVLEVLLGCLGGLARGRLLLTSRHRLEREALEVMQLRPMGIDEGRQLLGARMERLGAREVLEGMDGGEVSRLIRAVDGLPLALEMLASRLLWMGPGELLERLPEQAGLDPLEGVLALSWDQLEVAQREALMQASVFAGPAPLGWLEEVIALEEGAVWEVVESLVESSWLQVAMGQPRHLYMLHAVGRFVARRRAEESEIGARGRHAALMMRLSRGWLAGLAGPEELSCERALSGCYHELDAAHASMESGPVRAELGLALREALFRRGQLEGQRAILERALEDAGEEEGLLARGKLALAKVERYAGSFEASEGLLVEVIAHAREVGDGVSWSKALRAQLALANLRGELDTSLSLAERAVEVAEEHGRALDVIQAEASRGFLLQKLGRLEEAREALERAQVLMARGEFSPWVEVSIKRSVVATLERQQRFAQARALEEEVLSLARQIGQPQLLALELLACAELDLALGQGQEAPARIEEAFMLCARSGYKRVEIRAWYVRALYLFVERQWSESLGALQKARALMGERAEGGILSRIALQESRVLAKMGDAEAAQGVLEELPESAPQRLGGNLALAEAFVQWARQEPVERPAREELEDPALVAMWQMLPVEEEAALVLEVQEGGRGFALSSGESGDLTRRRAMRQILACLTRAALDQPGEPVDLETILEAGWPGEKMLHESGMRRVYVTISRLRSMGLEEVVLTMGDGYMIAPEVRVELG